MKNVILGILGAFILLFSTLICLGIYNIGVRKHQLESVLSHVVKHTLENGYQESDETGYEMRLKSDIIEQLGTDANIEIVIHEMDLQKGIVSVTLRESFRQFSGIVKELECTKTAIMERSFIEMPSHPILENGHDIQEMEEPDAKS